jgi:hypothetical protein
MGTNGGRPGSGETGNVVRIPRDWFGPKDELVPFGPRAWEGTAADSTAGPNDAPPLDGDLFWGEDAGSVHDVLDAPPEGSKRERRRTRPLVAAGAVGAIVVSAGIALVLIGGSPARPLPPAGTALANRADSAPSPRGLLRPVVTRTTAHRPRVTAHARGGRPYTSSASSIPVVSHSYETSSSTRVSYSPSSSSTSAVGASTTVSSARPAVVSAPATTQASQPAFGSGGALGPMSSPDG